MRTTLTLEPDVFRAAKQLAEAQSKSLGTVISELARKGLKGPELKLKTRNGFPIFEVSADAPIVTLEDLRRDEEEDDERHASQPA